MLGKTLDHRGLAYAGFTGEDRIVLAPPHQHVDDLADFLVAAEDRIHLAGLRLGGEVLRIATERRHPLAAGGSIGGAGCAGAHHAGAVHRPQLFLDRGGKDAAMFHEQRIDIDLVEFLRGVEQRALEFATLERRSENVAGADLRFAEKQRGVVPAAVERVDYGFRHFRHFGLILPKAFDHLGELGHQLRPVELETIGRQPDVGILLLQDVKKPVRQLDMTMTGALGVAQRLHESIVADTIEFAGDGFQADIGHGSPLWITPK